MNNYVILAFRKNDFSIMSRLIKWYTKSSYSHCEIIIMNHWISSSVEYGGVKVNKLRPLSDSWEYLKIEVQPELTAKALGFAFKQEGSSYDYFGVLFNQFLKINKFKMGNKWFCSEICARLLKELQEPNAKKMNPRAQSPGDLYKNYSTQLNSTGKLK